MQSFTTLLRTLLLLAFSADMLASAAAINEEHASRRIVIRQTTITTSNAGAVLSEAQACAQYSKIANLSVIGANSSYRSAFLDSSPAGTLQNAAMMNKAIADNMALMFDPALNAACGNATAVAIAEAASNFTQKIVAQFTFVGNPSSIEVGPIIAVVTGLCLCCFGLLTAL